MPYMDFETVADELYGLRPDEFTQTRTQRSKEARSQGDRELATEIGRLRKPSVAAWVVNLLVRRESGEIEQLLDLGEQLRQAQGERRGEDLRTLSQRRSQVVAALAGQGREQAAEAGHPVSEAVGREVEGTLEAALADPDAAAGVRAGRLVTALSYSGLGPMGAASTQSVGQPQSGRKKQPPGGRSKERGDAERAEQAVADVQRTVRRAEQAGTQARNDEGDARSRKEAAEERVERLEHDLAQARDTVATAERDLEDAIRRTEDADRELTAAQQRLDRERAAIE